MAQKNETKIAAEQGRQDIVIIREFDAPRDLVFRAFSNPDILVQWLGPRNMTTRIEKYDCRTGGSYRYFSIDDKGNEYGFNGVIHEVTAPERVIQTFEFEGLPERGHVSLDCSVFEELPGGRTRLTIQSLFRSVADRDGMVRSGMERGVNESYSRLDELLASGFNCSIEAKANEGNKNSMVKDVWMNLPVKDVQRSKVFFKALGFAFNEKMSHGDTNACLLVSRQNVVFMLFVETVFKSFVKREIPDTSKDSEVLFSFSADSREEVDEMAGKVRAAGGIL